MKKALARTLLIALTIVILAGVMPLSANASSSSNKSTIFSYLTQELGFNSAAACGIMANIEKESNFRSNVIIRDSNGLPSGGLCMWNGSRLTSLKNYCAARGLNYLSIQGQLSYLEYELQKSSYKHIYKYLKNVSNTSQGAYNAAHYWCYYFEVPASRSSKAVQRGNSAIRSYWPVYGGKDLAKPSLSVASGTTYEPDKAVTVNWTSAGKNANGYKVYLVSQNSKGEYDYNDAKVASLGASARSFTIKKHNMKIGSYKVYVYAYNSQTKSEIKSNVLTFTIKCKEHKYTSKITTKPTLKADGVETFTCSVCNKQTTKAYTLKDYISTSKVSGFRITGITDTKIKVRWDEFEYADGYRVYMKNAEGKWELIGSTTPKDDKAFMVKNLESNKTYSFRVKAYTEINGEKVYTKVSDTVSATTEMTKVTTPTEKVTATSVQEPESTVVAQTVETEENENSGLLDIIKDIFTH